MSRFSMNPIATFDPNLWANVKVSGTASGVAGPVILSRVVVNGGTLGALVIRDSMDASAGTVLANIAGPSAGHVFWYDAIMMNGISIFASAATDFTYVYKRA